VLVRGDSMHSSVRATMRWVYLDFRHVLDGAPTECSTKHVFERILEADIKAHAEEQRVAPASTPEPTTYASSAPVSPVAESSTTFSPTPSPSPSVVDAPSPQGEAVASQPSVTPGTGRANAELLAEPDFTRAIRDLQALRVLTGFREAGADSLLVEVSDHALTTRLSEYNFGQLFYAYYRMTGWNPRTMILFSHGGQVLAHYTRSGFADRTSPR